MTIGFETIGNATLILWDGGPVLVTDPWLLGGAYFGSWGRSHAIPARQMEAIQKCEYVWVSHGHPDHLSGSSLKTLKQKKILLPDHVGGRILDGFREGGYDVHVLKDRVWTRLSDHLRILCLTDPNQDAVLLADVNGRLIVNANDAQDTGWKYFVRSQTRKHKVSFLLCLTGFGDADMFNFFDENGRRILSSAARKIPVGKGARLKTESIGAKFFIPFSSMHRYQRNDSIWANEYVTQVKDYPVGFESLSSEILPPFIRYDCETDRLEPINPPENPRVIYDSADFGDDWAEPLEQGDVGLIRAYFQSIQHLQEFLDFINVRIGGKDHPIELSRKHFGRGIQFEVPRGSFMEAVKNEVFDDLLIGNFMKTTLLGTWPRPDLHPDFTPYVAKYADNGRAKSKQELERYFEEYRKRAFLDYLKHLFEQHITNRIYYNPVVYKAKLEKDKLLYRFLGKQKGRRDLEAG